ncbi:Translation elongation factor G [Candidatus Nasuia deltocephalinicola]|nr:Translation elongation factor G [Candidatus Nasuia deltocephalinicola]
MKIPINFYRNIGISAHIDAGKTTTTERILYYTGINHKIGEVHEGNTTMDWMDQEQERGITITSAAITTYWSGMDLKKPLHLINIIDTPGHVDFTIEVERCMRVIDGVCMIYCSVGGVQSQSETVWRQSNKYNIPRIIFVNKMDRIGSDFYKVYNQLKDVLNANPIPIFLPYYINYNFLGLIDLINFNIILWDDESKGKKFNYIDIPDDFLKISHYWRDKMIESVIDGDDFLIDEYLNKNEISSEEIKKSLRIKTISCLAQPMLCGSSFKNKGVQCLLDSILDFLPSPLDIKVIEGEDFSGNIITRNSDENDKFCALAFKIMSDPFVGQLIFFRVYSGIVKVGDIILNSNKNKKEKLVRLLHMSSNDREDIKYIGAGNIAAAVGLKSFTTGDTMCDINHPILLENIKFPEPVISQSIEAKNKLDREKLGLVLFKLSKEDPSFKYSFNDESSQIIINGMGELHLEILCERIKREYNLELLIGVPKVSYRETIKSSVKNIEGKYIRQSGGRGQYGHVVIDLFPNIKGGGFKFIDNIKGGIIPKEYISIIENSIKDSMNFGVLGGYPVLDIIVYLVSGSYHEVDSSENAFKIAASIAFKEAMKKADPILLEPIMDVEIETPDNYMGVIIGDISSKRGILLNVIDLHSNFKLLKSEIPLSEMFGYSTSLRSLTQGRSTFSMVFKNYSYVPKNIYNKILI